MGNISARSGGSFAQPPKPPKTCEAFEPSRWHSCATQRPRLPNDRLPTEGPPHDKKAARGHLRDPVAGRNRAGCRAAWHRAAEGRRVRSPLICASSGEKDAGREYSGAKRPHVRAAPGDHHRRRSRGPQGDPGPLPSDRREGVRKTGAPQIFFGLNSLLLAPADGWTPESGRTMLHRKPQEQKRLIDRARQGDYSAAPNTNQPAFLQSMNRGWVHKR